MLTPQSVSCALPPTSAMHLLLYLIDANRRLENGSFFLQQTDDGFAYCCVSDSSLDRLPLLSKRSKMDTISHMATCRSAPSLKFPPL